MWQRAKLAPGGARRRLGGTGRRWPVGPGGPATSTFFFWSMFVTILAQICHISYMQIILQAQVELDEI
jgi:hypothetical protein